MKSIIGIFLLAACLIGGTDAFAAARLSNFSGG